MNGIQQAARELNIIRQHILRLEGIKLKFQGENNRAGVVLAARRCNMWRYELVHAEHDLVDAVMDAFYPPPGTQPQEPSQDEFQAAMALIVKHMAASHGLDVSSIEFREGVPGNVGPQDEDDGHSEEWDFIEEELRKEGGQK